MSRKVLMIGSVPPPAHGQSIAFSVALEAAKKEFTVKVIKTSFRSNNPIGFFLKVIRYIVAVPWFIFVFRPNVVYFLCSRSLVGGMRDVYLLALLYFSDVRVLNHLHGSDFQTYLDSLPHLYQSLVKTLFRRVDKHAVLVDGMEKEFLTVTSIQNVQVIPNFYRLDKLEREISHSEIRNVDVLNVVYLSSIMPSKGIFHLIDAIKKVNNRNKKFRLLVAGGFLGDDCNGLSEVKEKFEFELNNNDFIEYQGIIGDKDKTALLKSSHIFSLPSYYRSEAVPLAILESMAVGCAVITTRYKYLPTFVKSGQNGELVNVKSVNDLAEKLQNLYDDREKLIRIMKNNQLQAKAMYSESVYKDNIIEFLRG